MDSKDFEFNQINEMYDECINYLKSVRNDFQNLLPLRKDECKFFIKGVPEYASMEELKEINCNIENEITNDDNEIKDIANDNQDIPDEVISDIDLKEDFIQIPKEVLEVPTNEIKSERLRRLSQQLPRIIITQSNTSISNSKVDGTEFKNYSDDCMSRGNSATLDNSIRSSSPRPRRRIGYGDYPRRLVSKSGVENVALISNVPFEKIRLLNDAFHTLINLRWRWIVSGTIVVHFTIWLVFAVFWYITALAHYDFDPDPPKKTCVTGGKDFVTIFLASVEAQTTIGFGDRTIDEECPESIFLFITQLILGTGLSGVLTCVVYAKLTRPEKLSRDGVGFSKKAVISSRDGNLCLMLRAWDLNYDHIISSEFSAHFVKTYRTKEGETIRYYARPLPLLQRQFLLWPVTLVHVIDEGSPFYEMTPSDFAEMSYEITVSLKGASASMGTFTQSQTSYLPREIIWGHRFPSVVRYDHRKQKYVINYKSLDVTEPVDTPHCSARHLDRISVGKCESAPPGSPSSFSEKISTFHLGRSSSFRRTKDGKA